MFKKLDKKHLINYITMKENKAIAKSNIKEMPRSELINMTTKQQLIDYIHDNNVIPNARTKEIE